MEYVYLVHTEGQLDGESFSEVLGVFRNLEDAKNAMRDDIAAIKEDWSSIDFDDEGDWEVTSDDELSYEGFTPCDDYSYSIGIERQQIR